MPAGRLYDEKVASYLAGLSPEARRMMLRRMGQPETPAEPATNPPPSAPVIAAPVLQTPEPPPPEPVSVDTRALFFEPFEPFVIGERLSQRQPGWLNAATFDGVWRHLEREVLPEEIGPLGRVLTMPPAAAAEFQRTLLPGLRMAAFGALEKLHGEAGRDPRRLQRLAARLGGEVALADLSDMLRLRPRLASLGALGQRLLPALSLGEPGERAAAAAIRDHLREGDEPAFVAVTVAGRIAAPAGLVRIAGHLAGAPEAVDLRQGPGAAFVDCALACAERHLIRFRAGLLRGGELAGLLAELKGFHDVVRGALFAAPLEDDRLWHQRLSVLRTEMSEPIQTLVDGVVPAIRFALRGDRWSRPEAHDRREAVKAAAILAAARRYRDALAVNGVVQRLWPLVDQALQTWGRATLDDLHKAAGPERDDLIAATETLVEIAEHIHGPEHAALLRRSRERALKG